MSFIDTTGVIRLQKKFTVNKISRFPENKRFLIGKEVLVLAINHASVSVRFGAGTPHWIPLRSLISIPGYEAKGVHSKNADGFVVKCPNEYGIDPGTTYLDPTHVDDTHATFTIDGKVVKFPLSIFIRVVRKAVKVKDKKVKKEAQETGIPLSVLESISSAVKVKDLTEVPSAVHKLIPELNIPELIANVKSSPVEVWDFDGNVHENIVDAQLSNERFIHTLVQEIVMKEVKKLLDGKFEDIRDNHNA